MRNVTERSALSWKRFCVEAFENRLRVALIRPADLRYSRMSGFGKPPRARETREVEPRKHTSSAQSD